MSLRIHATAIEVISLLRPLMPRLRRVDLALARQISRSASSIALNIAEGELSSGGHRQQRYQTAAGSASETRSALQVAQAWGYLSAADCKVVLGRLEHILAVLYKLTLPG
ncbi:MAG: four helix bundle protein [Polyangiaceae bacterium]|nr:four helix bundle protein [Polyangiaceae bacterium]MCB9605949.1 four helix bundle protein [Polyangiaceae bacterium]